MPLSSGVVSTVALILLTAVDVSYVGSMTSPVTDSRVPPLGSLGPSPNRPLGGIPPGPTTTKKIKINQKLKTMS